MKRKRKIISLLLFKPVIMNDIYINAIVFIERKRKMKRRECLAFIC